MTKAVKKTKEKSPEPSKKKAQKSEEDKEKKSPSSKAVKKSKTSVKSESKKKVKSKTEEIVGEVLKEGSAKTAEKVVKVKETEISRKKQEAQNLGAETISSFRTRPLGEEVLKKEEKILSASGDAKEESSVHKKTKEKKISETPVLKPAEPVHEVKPVPAKGLESQKPAEKSAVSDSKTVVEEKIVIPSQTESAVQLPAAQKTAEKVSHPPVQPKGKISVNETITVKDLADKMSIKVGDILMKLLKMGVRASLNQRLDIDTAILIASEFNYDAEFVPIYTEEAMTKQEEADESNQLVPRSPIVTVMGHVDHGKTSLLDAIRETKVAEKEAGGITQHIGAYKIKMDKGEVVFLDTPGHEAFTAMRARGAQVTDIVILVVAADDGVMPQTVEAIDHAKAAGVPIVVAVNKIDLPQAKPERIKQELSHYDLSPEEWGGKTIFVEVSAKKRINIDKLLEMIVLQAEILELKANPNRPAQGVVVESKLDPKKGPLATILVQKGTLKVGQTFVCGLTSGKVKALTDDLGRRILEAGPSTPVEVLGFSEPAVLGDKVIAVASEREAREIVERRKNLTREAEIQRKRHISLEMISLSAKEGKVKELKLIVKADVQGSVEALKDSIEKIPTQEIRLKVIHSGVGGITESDVSLAAASDAVIIGFTVRPEPAAEELARREGVEIKSYRIIYEVISDIRAAMEGLLEPEEKEVNIGRIEIRKVFKTPAGKVAGCMVVQGKVNRTAKVRLVRDSKIIFEGQIASLRRVKDDVREVEQGYECGISLENFNDFNEGDVLEAFIKEKHARKLG